MTPDHSITFQAGELGAESVAVARIGDVTMFFGLGPATGVASPGLRMEQVLDTLRPAVRTIRWGEQIHGRLIASLSAEPDQTLEGAVSVGRCDGLITSESGIGLVVWTADCVPVLMAGDGVVAAVHAGWRGAAEDIVGAAVKRFRTEYGVPASRLRAFLGPSISGPEYPVGQEVIIALGRHGIDHEKWRDGNHVDLRQFLLCRLQDLGLERTAVDCVGPCTASSPQLASFRRDGSGAGRQFSLVYRAAS